MGGSAPEKTLGREAADESDVDPVSSYTAQMAAAAQPWRSRRLGGRGSQQPGA